MLLMIDNYDSFTYNLVQYFGELGEDVQTYRNDEITLEGIAQRAPDRLVVSPGPCSPNEAGISVSAIRHFMGQLPILGVCLGHQAIGDAYSGDVVRAPEPLHGKMSEITHRGETLFAGINGPFQATRYHSLIVENVPSSLVINATSDDGHVMGFRHATLPIHSVQFHPESIATEHGHAMLANFMRIAGMTVVSGAEGNMR